jgi:hypothetical protein
VRTPMLTVVWTECLGQGYIASWRGAGELASVQFWSSCPLRACWLACKSARERVAQLPLHGEYPLPAGFHAGAAIAAASIAYRHTDDWEAGVAWLERYRQHWQVAPEANGCTLEDFRNGVPQERIRATLAALRTPPEPSGSRSQP